jgi:hypothetical protein
MFDYFRFARHPPTIGDKRQGSFGPLIIGLLWGVKADFSSTVAHLSVVRPIFDKRVTRKTEPSLCGTSRRIVLTKNKRRVAGTSTELLGFGDLHKVDCNGKDELEKNTSTRLEILCRLPWIETLSSFRRV